MTIKQTVNAALSSVLPNTWAVELPPKPTFPAIIFEINTTPEPQWVQGGGYDQHEVSIFVLAKTLDEISPIYKAAVAALELVPGYLRDGDKGDADYEDDPSVYAYFGNHVIRLRQDLG